MSTELKTLIVSDRLQISPPLDEVQICRWHERPSVESFPLVVLDLYFGDPDGDGVAKTHTDDPSFYEMGAEVTRCLKAGGVVMACLGPVANTPKKLEGYGHRNLTYQIKKDRLEAEQLPQPGKESSYDWLDQGLLSRLRLGHQYVKPHDGIQWKLPHDRFLRIREAFKGFFETFSGVVYWQWRDTLTYRVEEKKRWDTIQTVCQVHPQVLGVAEHTELPVAMSFDYNYFGGRLVLMPLFEIPTHVEVARLLVMEIKELGEWIYRNIGQETEEPPEWALQHLAAPAVAILEKISRIVQQKAELALQAEPYYQMLPLLYGTGTELEDALERLFDAPGERITVTRAERGAFIDLSIQDSSGRTLAVEATGVKGPLRHNDPHWADFLHYMPEHNAKNESGRVERIVLVVNTFRHSPPAGRDRGSDMTAPVKKTATDNGICVVRSADLYFLWLKTLEGMAVQEVFDTLFATEGIYEPPESPGG